MTDTILEIVVIIEVIMTDTMTDITTETTNTIITNKPRLGIRIR